MVKRKNQALIDSDSSNDSGSDLDSEFLKLAKKKNRKKRSPQAKSSSESEAESDSSTKNKKKAKRDSISSDSESEKDEKKDERNSEPEEGEVSDSSSSDEEFNDGYDDQLMGDEEDRARLAALTEKERETEIFKRIEQRELMKTRFEIEKKLRQARKAERAKDKSSKPPREKDRDKDKDFQNKLQTDFSSIDHKERSKERKKNIEENRGKVDKRVNAMAQLKAKREGKIKREEAEEERKKKEEQKKKDEEEQTLSTKVETKLKASDIYSDDSESEAGSNTSESSSPGSSSTAKIGSISRDERLSEDRQVANGPLVRYDLFRGFHLHCSDELAYEDYVDPLLVAEFQQNAPPGYVVVSVDPAIYPGNNAHRVLVKYRSYIWRRCEEIKSVHSDMNNRKPQNSVVGTICVVPGGYLVEYKKYCMCCRPYSNTAAGRKASLFKLQYTK